jgi:alpha-tubulin suppressor-like RCC1 family protein
MYARVQSGAVYHWGTFPAALRDVRGDAPGYVPSKLAGLDHVVEVRAGGHTACALKDDGTVWCWGDNSYESTGVPAPVRTGDVVRPTRVEGITDAVEIAVSATTSCARHDDGEVSCWGLVGSSEASGPTDPTPHRIPEVHRATQLAIAASSVFALLENGTVMAWGAYSDVLKPELYVDGGPPAPPTILSSLSEVRAISAHGQNACAIRACGEVWCWGANTWGELGLGTTSSAGEPAAPTPAPGLIASEISVGALGSCAKRATDDFTCFGQSLFGSLGTTTSGKGEAETPGARVVLPK